jgi:hypothetical protein
MDNIQCEHTNKKTNKQCENKAQFYCNGLHAYCMKHSEMSVFVAPLPPKTKLQEVEDKCVQLQTEMQEMLHYLHQMECKNKEMEARLEVLEKELEKKEDTNDYVVIKSK